MKLSLSAIGVFCLIGGTGLMTSLPVQAAAPASPSAGLPATAQQEGAGVNIQKSRTITGRPKPMPVRGMNAPQAAGMSVHQIAVLQESLDSIGAGLNIDGVWGPATEAALTQYQRNNALPVTGRLDKATVKLLDPVG